MQESPAKISIPFMLLCCFFVMIEKDSLARFTKNYILYLIILSRKSHAKNVKNAGVGDRLVDISSDEDKMSGLSEADMIPDLKNAEDPIEVHLP